MLKFFLSLFLTCFLVIFFFLSPFFFFFKISKSLGAPLILSGKYIGKFPQKVTIVGDLGKEKFRLEIDVINAQTPIHSLFIKQYLDILTAQVLFNFYSFFLFFFFFPQEFPNN